MRLFERQVNKLMSETSTLPTTATIARILGIGTAIPDHSILQRDAATVAQELGLSNRWKDALPALYRKSGVERRGSVLLGPENAPLADRQTFYRPASPAEPNGPSTLERMNVFSKFAGPLLHRACVRAIQQAKIPESRITHLVTVSCTGFFAPGVDIALIQTLGLDSNVQRTHVGFMGCHGALNAIRTAKAIVESDPTAVVLLGAVELCSLHQQYTDDAQQLVANALFADGAASLIFGAMQSESDACVEIEPDLPDVDDVSNADWTVASTLSKWIPDTTNMMSWSIGNHGFRMSLDPQVPGLVEATLKPQIQSWLARNSLAIEEIEAWAIHPGGPRIIQATGTALDLSPTCLLPSKAILANHGNMSSPTVLFILERMSLDAPNARSCVLIAFGPGLCIEAVLLKRRPPRTLLSVD